MRLWTQEYGTLWAIELSGKLPEPRTARVSVDFMHVGIDTVDLEQLATAMQLPNVAPIQERLQRNRHCYTLHIDGQIACYGWVTHGVESVGELEREFQLRPEEAYIWDCGTAPAWRGQRCYTALLSHLIHHLQENGTQRIWIGASRQNRASVSGIASAGFRQVVDVVYRRVWKITWLWLFLANPAEPQLVHEAQRVLVNPHERRIGRLVLGYLTQ